MSTKRDIARRDALNMGATDDEADFAARMAGHEATLGALASMLEVLPRETLVRVAAGLALTACSFDAGKALEEGSRRMIIFDRVVAAGRDD